jgi:hypothetical protein
MIKELVVEETPKTPHIDLNQFTGEITFSGKSIPENAAKVYESILKWVTEYIPMANPVTNLRLNLEYYNTATLLWLTKILKALFQIREPDYILIIHIYLPIDDFMEINDFEDIKDVFLPLSSIDPENNLSIGIKLYGTDNNGEIVRDALVLFEDGTLAN